MSYDGPPRDHAFAEERRDDDDARSRMEQSLKSKASWMRVLYIVFVLILYAVSRVVLGAVVLFQIGYVLFTGSTHKPLLDFGRSLAEYTYEIVMYITYNSDVRPFPFDAEWPRAPSGNEKPPADGNEGNASST